MDAAHDEATGLYFIVMEYVGGGSLAWHLRHGPLPEKKALAIITGIAHALVIAEENRIVHRDIKPENIMLDLRGMAKLADLGLAKHSLDTSLTIGGSFMGTPAYMSPEQARDAKIADTRDDIYSLGASFYECLTGEPPFQGETPYNIMSELLTKPSPRPRALRPDVTRSADLICRKMMAKTRDLRYQDARTLLQDLQNVQAHGGSRPRSTRCGELRRGIYPGPRTRTELWRRDVDRRRLCRTGRDVRHQSPRARLHSAITAGQPRRLQRRGSAHRAGFRDDIAYRLGRAESSPRLFAG